MLTKTIKNIRKKKSILHPNVSRLSVKPLKLFLVYLISVHFTTGTGFKNDFATMRALSSGFPTVSTPSTLHLLRPITIPLFSPPSTAALATRSRPCLAWWPPQPSTHSTCALQQHSPSRLAAPSLNLAPMVCSSGAMDGLMVYDDAASLSSVLDWHVALLITYFFLAWAAPQQRMLLLPLPHHTSQCIIQLIFAKC